MSKTHQQLWEDCLRIIADNIRPEQYDAWFKPVTSPVFKSERRYWFEPGVELFGPDVVRDNAQTLVP